MRGLDRGLRKIPTPQTHLRAREVLVSPTIPPAPPCPHKDHRTLPSPDRLQQPNPSATATPKKSPVSGAGKPANSKLPTVSFAKSKFKDPTFRLPVEARTFPHGSRLPARGDELPRVTGSRSAPGNGRETTPRPPSVRIVLPNPRVLSTPRNLPPPHPAGSALPTARRRQHPTHRSSTASTPHPPRPPHHRTLLFEAKSGNRFPPPPDFLQIRTARPSTFHGKQV